MLHIVLVVSLCFASYFLAAKEPASVITIDKITIAVGNMKGMTEFYGKTFGVTFKEVDIGGPKLNVGKLGNVELLLCPKDVAGIKATENTIQFRLTVADVAKTIETGIAAGGKAIGDINKQGGAVSGAIRDPDGNSIELIQKK